MARAKRQGSQDGPRGHLLVSRSALGRELSDRIERGNELISREILDERALETARADCYTWTEYDTVLLRRRFSNDELVDQYQDQFLFGAVFEQTLHEKVEEYREDVRRKLRHLQSIVEQLDLHDEPGNEAPATTSSTADSVSKGPPSIFVVPGPRRCA